MISISADETIFFDKLCSKIIDQYPKILFAGIISELGKLTTSRKRKDTELFVNKDEQEILFMEVALRVRMRHEFDLSLGPVDFTISQREKVTAVSMPFKGQVLYLFIEKDMDLNTIPKEILKLTRSPNL